MGRFDRYPLSVPVIAQIERAMKRTRTKPAYKIVVNIAWRAKRRKWMTRKELEFIYKFGLHQ